VRDGITINMKIKVFVRNVFIFQLVCAILGFCLISIVLLILDYMQRHQVTTLLLDYTAHQPFPALTICLQRQTPDIQAYNEKNLGKLWDWQVSIS